MGGLVQRSNVPCNGCTLCCQNDLLILHPEMGDDPNAYETMRCVNPITGKPALALAHKKEGGCIYLGDNGCTIHDKAPAICREFDCRKLFLSMTRPERRRAIKAGLADKGVFEMGRARLPSLPAAERKSA